MGTLWAIILSNLLISLIALVGIFFLTFKKEILDKIIFGLIALSAGTLMGGAFIHLLPEAIKEINDVDCVSGCVLMGFITFFLAEKIFYWHHCHNDARKIHAVAYLNLFGDAIHNFTDGLIIAASYSINISFGIATCIAIIAHEIPQEIGDFGVLIYAGLNKSKALWLNYMVALTSVLGGIVGYFLSEKIKSIIPLLLAFAAGGFIYIASSDLMPELRKLVKLKESIIGFSLFIFGILIMCLTKIIFGD